MPFDSNGQASISGNRPVNGQATDAAQINVPLNDIQNMLGQTLLKSGVAPMAGNLNFNGFKPINIADATNPSDAVSKSFMEAAIAALDLQGNIPKIVALNANRTLVIGDKATSFRVTGTRTITLPSASTLVDPNTTLDQAKAKFNNWWAEVWAVDGTVTISPINSETINGSTSLILTPAQKAIIFYNGTLFYAFVTSDATKGQSAFARVSGLELSPSSGDTANDVNIQPGSAGSTESISTLMVLPTTYVKRLDALWAVGSGNGGLDTGAITNAVYYAYLIQRPDTLVTDVIFSRSSSSPTMPANYTRYKRIGSMIRISGKMAINDEGIYQGSSASNLDFPIGSTIIIRTYDTNVARNDSLTPCLNTLDSGAFALSGTEAAGTALVGGWVSRGGFGSNTNNDYLMAQRIY